jgi:hypothetical protein
MVEHWSINIRSDGERPRLNGRCLYQLAIITGLVRPGAANQHTTEQNHRKTWNFHGSS